MFINRAVWMLVIMTFLMGMIAMVMLSYSQRAAQVVISRKL